MTDAFSRVWAKMRTSLEKELAISYLRFSVPEQAKGDSTRRQLEEAQRYADAHNLIIIDSFEDHGFSGYTGKHRSKGALGDLVKLAKDGVFAREGIRHLLVESFDRLSREDIDDALFEFRALLSTGLTIHIVKDGKAYIKADMSDLVMLMSAILFMSRANEESKTKSMRLCRTRANTRKLAAEGKRHVSKTGPSWTIWSDHADCPPKLRDYSWQGRSPWHAPIPQRVGIMREFVQRVADGETVSLFARRLNERGVRPFRHGNAKWSTSVLTRFIYSPALLGFGQFKKMENGKQVPAGDPIPDYFEPIVDAGLLARARAQLKARRPAVLRLGKKGEAFTNVFSGLCVPMWLRQGYLRCSAEAMFAEGKHGRGFSLPAFEAAVLNHIADLDVSKVMRDEKAEAAIDGIKNQVAGLQDRLERLTALADGHAESAALAKGAAKADYMAKHETALAEKATVTGELEELEGELARFGLKHHNRSAATVTIEKLKAAMETATGADLFALRARLNRVLASFIDQVRFDPDTGNITVILLGGIRTYRFTEARENIPIKGGSKKVTLFCGRIDFVPVDFMPTDESRDRERMVQRIVTEARKPVKNNHAVELEIGNGKKTKMRMVYRPAHELS
jgi:DNA invertase Pin-like site-specific DNA recombinase